MIRTIFTLIAFAVTNLFAQELPRLAAEQLKDEGLKSLGAFKLLQELTSIGPRLSGSAGYEKAVVWGKKKLLDAGCDSVWLQTVLVPHWVRGNVERASVHFGKKNEPLSICALGGSIATPKKGLRAEVIEVSSFEEVHQLGDKARGKIIFFNRPFDVTNVAVGEAYGGAVNQRGNGAIEAAKEGAIAVLVRSMTNAVDDVPHTGMMRYNESVPKIPAAAISTIGANKLSDLLKKEKNVTVEISLECKILPDVQSYNVIGELRGIEKPDEIVLIGAHLDSWDKGTGAHDDGAGVAQCIEAVKLLKQLNLKLTRTVRVVLFANEENGLRGAKAYAERDENKIERHIAAIESDYGGFQPRGFSVKTDSASFEKVKIFSDILSISAADQIRIGGGGADVNELAKFGTVCFELNPDSQRYFDYHHSSNDTIDKVHPRELELGAISLAILSLAIAQNGI